MSKLVSGSSISSRREQGQEVHLNLVNIVPRPSRLEADPKANSPIYSLVSLLFQHSSRFPLYWPLMLVWKVLLISFSFTLLLYFFERCTAGASFRKHATKGRVKFPSGHQTVYLPHSVMETLQLEAEEWETFGGA